MDLVDIKYLIAKKGLSFTAIDRLNNLREGSVRLAVAKPHKKGEIALSQALGIPAYSLFPERYDKDGKRYEPQPRGNYNYKQDVTLNRRNLAQESLNLENFKQGDC